MFYFYVYWKYEKIGGLLMYLEGKEKEYWLKIG